MEHRAVDIDSFEAQSIKDFCFADLEQVIKEAYVLENIGGTDLDKKRFDQLQEIMRDCLSPAMEQATSNVFDIFEQLIVYAGMCQSLMLTINATIDSLNMQAKAAVIMNMNKGGEE